jgi:hypothetical protein
MKNLELTQSVHSPQSSVGVLGLAMDDESALAIGMFLGDSGYGWPGDVGQLAALPPGTFWDCFGGKWSHFPCQLPPQIPHPIIGMGSPLEGISSTYP